MGRVVLQTERLLLRPFSSRDAEGFRALAGDWDVARMTSDIPHPLTPQDADAWLRPTEGERRFAIEHMGHMIGGVGYFQRVDGAAELGFWLGRNHWRRGFATEAVQAVLLHGFGPGRQRAFSSSHFIDNPASGRVLEKAGFEPSGCDRIWSAARGTEVLARCLRLTRARAEATLEQMSPAKRSGRFASIIGRLVGPG